MKIFTCTKIRELKEDPEAWERWECPREGRMPDRCIDCEYGEIEDTESD